MLDIEARNKYDEMAYELVCNDDSSSSEAKKKRIRNLFSGMHAQCVVLLISDVDMSSHHTIFPLFSSSHLLCSSAACS